MNSAKILVAAALFTGLATLGSAGPNPELWARQAKIQQARNFKADRTVTAQPATQVALCGSCNCAAVKKS